MNDLNIEELLESDLPDDNMTSPPQVSNKQTPPTQGQQPEQGEDQSDLPGQMITILLQSVSKAANNQPVNMENLPMITKALTEDEKDKLVHGLKYIPQCSLKNMLNALVMPCNKSHVTGNNHIIPNKRSKLQAPDSIEWRNQTYSKHYIFTRAKVFGYQSKQGLSVLLCLDPDYTEQIKHTILMISNTGPKAALVMETSCLLYTSDAADE